MIMKTLAYIIIGMVLFLNANFQRQAELRPMLFKIDPVDLIVRHEAKKYQNVYPGLIHAIIDVESGYNPKAVSVKNCKGLMQVSDAAITDYNWWHGTRYNPKDMFIPAINIKVGTWYLAERCFPFHDNITNAISAYNQGPWHPNMRTWYYKRVLMKLKRGI